MYSALLERLVELKMLGPDEARDVERRSVLAGKSVQEVVLEKNGLSEDSLLGVIGELLGVQVATDLASWRAAPEYLRKIPVEFSRKYTMVGLEGPGGGVELAVSDPFDTFPLDDVAVQMGREVRLLLAPREKIRSFIADAYEMDVSMASDLLGELDSEALEGITREVEESEDLVDMANKAPVVKLINTLLFQALKMRASDIHVQPYERHVQVRFRIDGILYDITQVPKPVQEAVSSRIKVMGKMDIAERRLPQDGQTSFLAGGREVDVRISTIPSAHGERVVMRLQDKSTGIYRLDRIGMSEDDLEKFSRLIRMSHGIILVTGPTGSGKTTTLYGALSEINSPEKNIITVEDPIEYLLPGISQIQVAPKKGMTFASGLRHIVRQDPDIIMVGEIRDIDTAGIAIQSALTGHLVFSTLHTNDAPGAVSRMLDLGVEPFLVNSSLIAVVAQRLVRRVCGNCLESYVPTEMELAAVGLTSKDLPGERLVRGTGCEMCADTGYVGRLGIFEILEVDDFVKKAIMKRKSGADIKREAIDRGLKTLRMDGMEKALAGMTTLEEVQRVTQVDVG